MLNFRAFLTLMSGIKVSMYRNFFVIGVLMSICFF